VRLARQLGEPRRAHVGVEGAPRRDQDRPNELGGEDHSDELGAQERANRRADPRSGQRADPRSGQRADPRSGQRADPRVGRAREGQRLATESLATEPWGATLPHDSEVVARTPRAHHLTQDRELPDVIGVVVGEQAHLTHDRVPGCLRQGGKEVR